ncbi:MAG TPA: hypothetical protein PLI59_05685, partial [Candidatus Obscuribacter sp.]|nr:hypothetical protein [Candidatus Obscuribacter sp.]
IFSSVTEGSYFDQNSLLFERLKSELVELGEPMQDDASLTTGGITISFLKPARLCRRFAHQPQKAPAAEAAGSGGGLTKTA